jgi:[ribosomal protein S18]-alanine N-acetyltransferase
MPEELEIAPVRLADLPAIVRIEETSFPAPWRREFFEEELGTPGRMNLVARREGEVAGYLFATWLFDEMHVNKIAVIESQRRRGIADALMDRCLSFARANGIETVALEVREANDVAQSFYAHLGFERTYVRKRYYPDGESAVVMMLRL